MDIAEVRVRGPERGPVTLAAIMLIYAGIDEAGYGPLLGPLCVAASIFVVDDDTSSGAGAGAATGARSSAAGAATDPRPQRFPDLWNELGHAVCRSPADAKRRIAVEDSKKLKGARDARSHPLRHLERGVLAFMGALARHGTEVKPWSGADVPLDDDQLLARLGACLPSAEIAPWYSGPSPLPLAHDVGQLEIAAASLRRCERVRCAALLCEVVDVAEFNRHLALSRSKASVSFDSVVRLVNSIWNTWPTVHPRVVIDRQGGRTMYREPLSMCFPEAEITILGETERLSRYRLERGGSTITLSFETESEAAHLPTALASMTAKYIRELLMLRFNRWFAGHVPEIKPTAGYFQDGQRWLGEMETAIESLGVDRTGLVRNG